MFRNLVWTNIFSACTNHCSWRKGKNSAKRKRGNKANSSSGSQMRRVLTQILIQMQSNYGSLFFLFFFSTSLKCSTLWFSFVAILFFSSKSCRVGRLPNLDWAWLCIGRGIGWGTSQHIFRKTFYIYNYVRSLVYVIYLQDWLVEVDSFCIFHLKIMKITI